MLFFSRKCRPVNDGLVSILKVYRICLVFYQGFPSAEYNRLALNKIIKILKGTSLGRFWPACCVIVYSSLTNDA